VLIFYGRILKAYLWLVGQKSVKVEDPDYALLLNGMRAVFHRPHPQKETDKGAVVSIRRFLTEAGVEP